MVKNLLKTSLTSQHPRRRTLRHYLPKSLFPTLKSSRRQMMSYTMGSPALRQPPQPALNGRSPLTLRLQRTIPLLLEGGLASNSQEHNGQLMPYLPTLNRLPLRDARATSKWDAPLILHLLTNLRLRGFGSARLLL